MRKPSVTWFANARHAQSIWGKLPSTSMGMLKQLTKRLALSVAGGDLLFLEGRWYVTHSGLLRIAQRRRCSGIKTVIQDRLSDPPSGRWVFRATVYKTSTKRNNGHQNGQPRLRDRLCLLIRQYQLDAGLVKAYAADYCGTATLRDARRDQVETFINDLTERAAKDREGLICQLNSYAKQQEVTP